MTSSSKCFSVKLVSSTTIMEFIVILFAIRAKTVWLIVVVNLKDIIFNTSNKNSNYKVITKNVFYLQQIIIVTLSHVVCL